MDRELGGRASEGDGEGRGGPPPPRREIFPPQRHNAHDALDRLHFSLFRSSAAPSSHCYSDIIFCARSEGVHRSSTRRERERGSSRSISSSRHRGGGKLRQMTNTRPTRRSTPGLLALACALLLVLLTGANAECSSCDNVSAAAKECSANVSLSKQAALQSTLLLNCAAALWQFGGDRCCEAMTTSGAFSWEEAKTCLCGGQTGLSGLVISAKTIVESCGCTTENARTYGTVVPNGFGASNATVSIATNAESEAAAAGGAAGIAAPETTGVGGVVDPVQEGVGRKRKF